MNGFSMIQAVRTHGHLMDRRLKRRMVRMYQPMRWIPCLFQHWMDALLRRRKNVEVIVQFQGSANYNQGIRLLQAYTGKRWRKQLKRLLPTMAGCAVKLSMKEIEALCIHCHYIKKIYLDRDMSVLLERTAKSVKVDQLYPQGVTGKGVTVAVLDTGVSPHEDLTSRIIGFKDFVKHRLTPYDDNGHGTHCAGCIASEGGTSEGRYRGMAPEASLVVVKVLNRFGSGALSDVISGIDWCVQHKNVYGIRVLSMSLGGRALEVPEEDPVVQAVERAWRAGIMVIVAAGNDGPDIGTIASPGISAAAMTVGASVTDGVATFSSRGPTVNGDVKPDILAPGVNIISLRAPGSWQDKFGRKHRQGGHHFISSGTSMSTPIVAGIAALLFQQAPHATPDDIKTVMLATCDSFHLDQTSEGAGVINAEKAIELLREKEW
ncbi:S8 family peptidase [Aureibacillus halotolerans]|uniref:Serine protease AprX n=1 Tax=Aureibacillus halotolerans TaxID=1508390 RepID=A0A4V3D5R0_9BACI|nr:S8 family peptidase [Aureibacillus halotolerans]TDQ41047.1 serine protease AprX [Aureibacillus halotolerans]